MSHEPLHGPSAEDRRQANALRPPRVISPSGLEQDTALRRASHDRRIPWPARALAWVVSTYNRAPPRLLLDDMELPGLIAGFLPVLGRYLGLWSIGRQKAGEHLSAARGTPLWSSGWTGTLVLAVVWSLPLLLLTWVAALAPAVN